MADTRLASYQSFLDPCASKLCHSQSATNINFVRPVSDSHSATNISFVRPVPDSQSATNISFVRQSVCH
jgi:hypothetical protein